MNNTEQFNVQIMHKVWDTEQEILDVIHSVCIENNLKYSLFYGTLLGAVRHGGFIPWDDDIDIAMPREDYDELIQIWNEKAPKGYLLQTYYTDDDLVNNFAKIRKDHTTYLEDEAEAKKKHHKGVFVDIFPFDRVAPVGIKRKSQYFACAVNLLLSRGYTSGTGGVTGMVERALLSLSRSLQITLRNRAEQWFCKWNDDENAEFFNGSTLPSCKKYFPKDAFDNLKLIDFCGKSYLSVEDTDSCLTSEYGDYMQLPPEEDRVWKHHPILIDFEHNYEEIKDV